MQETRKRHGFDPWVERSPGGGNGNPVQYSCLQNPHRQRKLAGYSPQGDKEQDMTEVILHACIKFSVFRGHIFWISYLCYFLSRLFFFFFFFTVVIIVLFLTMLDLKNLFLFIFKRFRIIIFLYIYMPAGDSSSLAFHMMYYSTYKLNTSRFCIVTLLI